VKQYSQEEKEKEGKGKEEEEEGKEEEGKGKEEEEEEEEKVDQDWINKGLDQEYWATVWLKQKNPPTIVSTPNQKIYGLPVSRKSGTEFHLGKTYRWLIFIVRPGSPNMLGN
jgi:hypothetical protein